MNVHLAVRHHHVPVRPQLALAPPPPPWWDVPSPRGPRHWLWQAREAAATAVYHAATFTLDRLATRRYRERAWLAGYAFALGAGRRGYWITYLAEYTAGNEAGWELRHSRGDSMPGRCRLVEVR